VGRTKGGVGMALLSCVMLAGVAACGGKAVASAPGGGTPAASSSASAKPSASPSPTRPAGPPLLLDSITPADGGVVGVAMPISIVFTHPVASSARAAVERHLKVTTSTGVAGAWHWFGEQRVDWRPEKFWTSGTRVTVDAELTGVPDGNGRYGTHGYRHSFTIGSDVETTVSVPGHSMKVYRAGALVRTMPIDAGSPSFPSWDGTMAVIDKQTKVRMTSCSVNITCDKSNPNYYDLTLPWDVHLTYSGTYVHYSTGDPYPGHSYGSHGCVHLSLADAKGYFDYVKQGDPVTITGSPRGKAAGDNGYAAFNLSWSQWLSESATGAQPTATS
jgi:lipoprotein-anchoring transpeptidase ErfK/SrfK